MLHFHKQLTYTLVTSCDVGFTATVLYVHVYNWYCTHVQACKLFLQSRMLQSGTCNWKEVPLSWVSKGAQSGIEHFEGEALQDWHTPQTSTLGNVFSSWSIPLPVAMLRSPEGYQKTARGTLQAKRPCSKWHSPPTFLCHCCCVHGVKHQFPKTAVCFVVHAYDPYFCVCHAACKNYISHVHQHTTFLSSSCQQYGAHIQMRRKTLSRWATNVNCQVVSNSCCTKVLVS